MSLRAKNSDLHAKFSAFGPNIRHSGSNICDRINPEKKPPYFRTFANSCRR
jgi:hypothetical protein